MKKIGIEDVARASGVSNATASYALNGKDRVSENTRLKVISTASALGYIPNNSAVRLRTGRSNLLGAIVNDITNPFFAELMAEFENFAWSNGFLSIVATSQDDPKRQNHLIRSMLSQGVAGVIVSPVHGSREEDFKPFADGSLPFIVCVRDIENFDHSFIGIDDLRAGFIAGKHILDRGHRNIAFVGGYEHTTTWQLRVAGIRQAAQELGIADISLSTYCGGEGPDFGSSASSELLESNTRPTIIVGLNDDTANGVYLAAAKKGLEVGTDISVLGFDNIPQSRTLIPGLTTVELFPRQLGKTCAKKLVDLIENADTQPVQIRLAPTLIDRDSVSSI